MINLETIERTIDELENTRDTSYRLCERLSWLYICRDHLKPQRDDVTASRPRLSGSEFLEAASAAPYEALLRVLDEHMSTIQLIYPTTYDNVIKKIRELS